MPIKNLRILIVTYLNCLKGVHPIIFGSNIFSNPHLIQKCIQFQLLFWNSCWFCIHFWIKWELGKIFNTKMIGWTPFRWLFFGRSVFLSSSNIIWYFFFSNKHEEIGCFMRTDRHLKSFYVSRKPCHLIPFKCYIVIHRVNTE